MLEERLRSIENMLRVMDGPLTDATRLEMGLHRIVAYLRASETQQHRVDEWLYEPEKRVQASRSFPLDQGVALCEAHFLFVCWDSVYKVIKNLQQNAYGIVTPRKVIKKHRQALVHYQRARNHLEHLPERFPGQCHTDWQGDENQLSGTVPGIRRHGFFVFQGEEWDVTEASVVQLTQIVTDLIEGIHEEVTARYVGYLQGDSAIQTRSGQ